MAFLRVLLGMWRIVTCGIQTVDDDEDRIEMVRFEMAVSSDLDSELSGCMSDDAESVDADALSVEEREPVTRRQDSLERGFQDVMQRAKTFAHKWSQPDLRKELRISLEESSSDAESQGDSVELKVERQSSQVRFEQLMLRTSQFYQRCSTFLQ